MGELDPQIATTRCKEMWPKTQSFPDPAASDSYSFRQRALIEGQCNFGFGLA